MVRECFCLSVCVCKCTGAGYCALIQLDSFGVCSGSDSTLSSQTVTHFYCVCVCLCVSCPIATGVSSLFHTVFIIFFFQKPWLLNKRVQLFCRKPSYLSCFCACFEFWMNLMWFFTSWFIWMSSSSWLCGCCLSILYALVINKYIGIINTLLKLLSTRFF